MRSQLGKATALAIMGKALGQTLGGCVWKWEWCLRLSFLLVLTHPPGDKLWWADQVSEKMGTCNKADGSGSVVLRNSTTLVMHMKVYDESVQLGEAAGAVWGTGDLPLTGFLQPFLTKAPSVLLAILVGAWGQKTQELGG